MKQILTILIFFYTLGIYAQSTTVTRPQKKPQATESKAKTSGAHSSSQKKTSTSSINSQKPTSGSTNGHDWVDLGLPSGTKWATMNVGANSPSDYGSYFAWGETRPKSSYHYENLRYCISGDEWYNVKFSKYVTDSMYGNVDGKKELDLSDDAAYVYWGSGWRMPSVAQIDELVSNCTTEWTTMNGKWGRMMKSLKNGKSIFLPAAGYWNDSGYRDSIGGYWSRSLQWGGSRSTSSGYSAYFFSFALHSCNRSSTPRFLGLSVRPVLVPYNPKALR